MLTEIKLNGFASFKHETCLQTDKPINFVYGLNGTGKSSLTRYLAHRDEPKYAQCSITPAIDPDKEETLVYKVLNIVIFLLFIWPFPRFFVTLQS